MRITQQFQKMNFNQKNDSSTNTLVWLSWLERRAYREHLCL